LTGCWSSPDVGYHIRNDFDGCVMAGRTANGATAAEALT